PQHVWLSPDARPSVRLPRAVLLLDDSYHPDLLRYHIRLPSLPEGEREGEEGRRSFEAAPRQEVASTHLHPPARVAGCPERHGGDGGPGRDERPRTLPRRGGCGRRRRHRPPLRAQ